MATLAITTKPGKKYRSLKRPRVYEALRKQGMSKQSAARISNAQAHKSYTIQQLEAFVSSPHYDAQTAGLIALSVPALKADGELISPGVRRIHGNLCNVHGRYGPCDKALSGKKKPKGRARKPAKPKQTDAQRATERQGKRDQNIASVAQRMADTDTGLSPSGSKALAAFAQGQQPDATQGAGLTQMGLAEQASDGSYRMTPTGRAVVAAMAAGDYQRAVDGISRATDQAGKRRERTTAQAKRQQDSAGKRASARVGRELAKREREAAAKKREAERAAKRPGGRKKPEKQAVEKPRKLAPVKRIARSSAPSAGSVGGSSTPKPKPAPEKAPAKPTKEQTTAANRGAVRQAMAEADAGLSPSGFDSLIALSAGAEPEAAMADDLISMGMAERGSDGTLRLSTAARQVVAAANRGDTKAAIDIISRATEPKKTKAAGGALTASKSAAPAPVIASRLSGNRSNPSIPLLQSPAARALPYQHYTPSFRVFKDAQGRHRWVAQSSTAFQDRDREIVSTKALQDDCAFADETGSYGPLRWWHTPGLDLGDCDFNAMHGRVLIESGTFRSAAIAQKVATAASGLEISLGFLHLPSEPDASGVFHHIRRFERSLVPRGKASNRFTAFTVKEMSMFDPTKVAALKTLGFSDDDITNLQTQAEQTEKTATDQGIAFKADNPTELPDVVINGVTYKAVAEETVKDDGEGDMEVMAEEPIVEEEAVDENALTLSQGDLAAISEAISAGIAQVMGALDLEKKVAGHVQSFMAPFQQAQTTKDAEVAETKEQLAALATKVAELTGDQPAVQPYRASAAKDNVLSDATLLAAAKASADPSGTDPWADIKQGLGLARPQQ